MWDWLKGARRRRIEANVLATQRTWIEFIAGAWEATATAIPSGITAEDLASEIEHFAGVAVRFMFRKFPLSKNAPPAHLWLIVFSGIRATETHPTALLNEAMDLLQAKNGRAAAKHPKTCIWSEPNTDRQQQNTRNSET